MKKLLFIFTLLIGCSFWATAQNDAAADGSADASHDQYVQEEDGAFDIKAPSTSRRQSSSISATATDGRCLSTITSGYRFL